MDWQYVIQLHGAQQYDKDEKIVNIWVYVLFGIFFFVAWFVVISLIRQLSSAVKYRVLTLYHVNLLWLLVSRMIWFAGAFNNNYPMTLYFFLNMICALQLFTAASVLIYFWYKLNLQWRWLVMELNDQETANRISRGFRVVITVVVWFYAVFLIVFCIVQVLAGIAVQVLTINCMYGLTDIAWGVGNVVTGQTLVTKVKTLTKERPYRIMGIMYMVGIVCTIRLIVNIIISIFNSYWATFPHDHQIAFVVQFCIFVLVLELLPVVIVLFSIKQTRPEKFNRNQNLLTSGEADQSDRASRISSLISQKAQNRLSSLASRTYSSSIQRHATSSSRWTDIEL